MTSVLSRNIKTRNKSRKNSTSVAEITVKLNSSSDNVENKAIPRTPRKQKSTLDDGLLRHCSTTPPKQKKFNDVENEPCTPPKTPSTLLKDLTLTSPVNNKNVYRSARKALHSTFQTKMVCREKELDELRDFIKIHLCNEMSGTIYISGPPGTGKTATLNIILQEKEITDELKEIYINCTSIKSSGSVYSRIVKELNLKSTGKKEKDYLTTIENYLTKNHKTILLILDEIDQLESKKQSVLYTIFEWPSKLNSKLILIGIANALDLTDRILPRLQICMHKPKLMHFSPYTKQQIVKILTTRLEEAGVLEVFSPTALQMLAGKVAAISGDVRRALDIGRRVIEVVQQNKNSAVLHPLENIDSLNLKPVELKEVMNVLGSVYDTTQNLTDDTEDCIPLQQKIVICSLLLIIKKGKSKDATIGKLHEVYKKVCSKRNLLAVDQSEFSGLCSLIESKGIIKVTKRKEIRLCKVSLEWNEEEVAAALKDKQLLSVILQDENC